MFCWDTRREIKIIFYTKYYFVFVLKNEVVKPHFGTTQEFIVIVMEKQVYIYLEIKPGFILKLVSKLDAKNNTLWLEGFVSKRKNRGIAQNYSLSLKKEVT